MAVQTDSVVSRNAFSEALQATNHQSPATTASGNGISNSISTADTALTAYAPVYSLMENNIFRKKDFVFNFIIFLIITPIIFP